MRYLRMTGMFIRAAVQQDLAYRANFWIYLLHSGLTLFTAVVALQVLFGQVQAVRGWDFPATLALMGVYLSVSALRGVCLGPSLDSLAGMDGELWTGRFDFTLLRPADLQFLASFRIWQPFALLDLALGLGVIVSALAVGGTALPPERVGLFFLALAAGVVLVYAILLALSALVFWSPGLLFTWVFDAVFQLARYPVGIYPGWLRLVLTWGIPIALITTVPAEALTGRASPEMVLSSLGAAAAALAGASWLFRTGARRYTSASS